MPAHSPSASSTARRSTRTTAERRVVVVLLLLLLIVVVVLSTLGVQATLAHRDERVRADEAVARADRAFARAGLEQLDFHGRRGRFAFWEELAADGLRLPKTMVVDTSNATPSHWYLRLRDRATGMLCDRVGMVSDEPGGTSGMECRPL